MKNCYQILEKLWFGKIRGKIASISEKEIRGKDEDLKRQPTGIKVGHFVVRETPEKRRKKKPSEVKNGDSQLGTADLGRDEDWSWVLVVAYER